ncbi:MAG: diguanylate cyclase [Coriobacteriales bacterium]|nr:diguanylate cyclase [Coriobacteriales bacterium]
MRFRSLQTKYLALIAVSLTSLALVISVACVKSYSSTLGEIAASRMNLVTDSFVHEIDSKFQNMELTTTTLADYVREKCESHSRLATDEAYRKAYLADVEDFAARVMATDNVLTSYFVRYDIQKIGPNTGFRYRRNRAGDFKPAQMTKLEDYDQTDFEHVGWYYEPINTGAPVLMDPYYDADQKLYKITYAIPVYLQGELLAVTGADVAFQSLADSVSSLAVMPDATAFLCRSNGELYYHENVQMDDDVARAQYFDCGKELGDKSDGQMFDGTLGGEPVKYAYERLFGDLYIVESRPVSGIYRSVNELVVTVTIASTLFVTIALMLALFVSRSIVRPLRQLDEAASNILESDAIFELDPRGEDEVSTLTRHFQGMARELKKSLEHLNSIAYRDGLTGVRNRRGYDIEVDLLNERIARGEAEFGIGVFDVNGLKEVNDTYGHDAGNEVIITASTRLKECFKHSAVFRIGGDEFACVLQGADLDKSDECLEHFRRLTVAENAIANEPWQEVYIAAGTSKYAPGTDNCVADVFNRADEEMYQNKARMKGAENIR